MFWCDCAWHSKLIYPNSFGLIGYHINTPEGVKIWIMGHDEEVLRVASFLHFKIKKEGAVE